MIERNIEQKRPTHFPQCDDCQFADYVMEKSVAFARVSKNKAARAEVTCTQPKGNPQDSRRLVTITGVVEFVKTNPSLFERKTQVKQAEQIGRRCPGLEAQFPSEPE